MKTLQSSVSYVTVVHVTAKAYYAYEFLKVWDGNNVAIWYVETPKVEIWLRA